MLATLEHLSVWMVDGYIKAKSLQQNVLIVDELLRLLVVLLQKQFSTTRVEIFPLRQSSE